MQRSLIFLLSQHTPPLQSSRADIVYSFLLEKFSLFTKLRWFTTSNWNLFSKKPTNIYFQVTNPTNPKLPNIGLKLAGGGGGRWGEGNGVGFRVCERSRLLRPLFYPGCWLTPSPTTQRPGSPPQRSASRRRRPGPAAPGSHCPPPLPPCRGRHSTPDWRPSGGPLGSQGDRLKAAGEAAPAAAGWEAAREAGAAGAAPAGRWAAGPWFRTAKRPNQRRGRGRALGLSQAVTGGAAQGRVGSGPAVAMALSGVWAAAAGVGGREAGVGGGRWDGGAEAAAGAAGGAGGAPGLLRD